MLCHQLGRGQEVRLALHVHARVHLQSILAQHASHMVAYTQGNPAKVMAGMDSVSSLQQLILIPVTTVAADFTAQLRHSGLGMASQT